MPKILLFIPFYNCEKQIPRVLAKVKDQLEYFQEVLIVDNQSQDKGLEVTKDQIIKNNLSKMTLIQNCENVNLGGSHKVAFQYAVENNYDYVVVLHGDDQADINDIIFLIQNSEYMKYDCLLGARFHSASTLIGYSKFRTFGNIVLNFLCSIVCKRKIQDMGSGLNMYSKKFFDDSRILNFPNDLTFNVFLLFHSCWIKSSVRFFPLTWRELDQVSNAKVFNQFFNIIKLIASCFFNKTSLYKKYSQPKLNYDTIYKS